MPPFEPRLIEHGFPCHQVGAETQRERGASSALPPLYFLHVWWARRPLTPSRAAILASLSSPDLSPDDFLRQLGIEQHVVDIGGDKWVLTGDLLARVRRNQDGAEVLPVDAFVMRRFEKEQQRRAANFEIATKLEREDPALAGNPILQRWKLESRPLTAPWVREAAEWPVLSRAADPDFAKARIEFEKLHGIRTPEDKYGYRRAFDGAPMSSPSSVVILDPTAGGGSIPFEALRLGHHVIANELNPVATTILYATLDYPARFGISLVENLKEFGERLLSKMRCDLIDLFPVDTIPAGEAIELKKLLSKTPELIDRYLKETLDGFLFCRQVTCPHCGGEAPLLNSCWLAKDDDEPWAVRIIPDGQKRGGKVRFEAYRRASASGADDEDPDIGTVADGIGRCVHCHHAISGDEIKAQASGRSEHGRWTDRLYCVAAVRFEPKLDGNGHPERYKSGERKGEIKTRKVRFFRPPNHRDLDALAAADQRLAEKWPEWDAAGIIPTENIPTDINDTRPIRYGMTRWCDLFTPRQLLGHLTLVEELLRLKPKIITALGDERGRAVITYLQFVIDKCVDYNSRLSFWDTSGRGVRHTFSGRDYRLRWMFGEMIFTGPSSGAAWALDQVIDAYRGIAQLVEPIHQRVAAGVELPVNILHGTAAHLAEVADGSVDLICMDPPYYNNVQYAELSDYFYVWQKSTLSSLFPHLYQRRLTNKVDEAVASAARDGSREQAHHSYERLMGEIFSECRRVLRDDGIMTLMFMHSSQEAWQAINTSLIREGWQIVATFPVDSETTAMKEDAGNAQSSIFLSCRKRMDAAQLPASWIGIGDSGVRKRIRRAVEDALHEFEPIGLQPVDEMVACYGRALQVLSEHWPVMDGNETVSPFRAMNEASSVVAANQITRLTKGRITVAELDGETRMALTMFGVFGLKEFAWDEALNLSKSLGIGLHAAAGGYEVDNHRIGVNTAAEGRAKRARGAEAEAHGFAAPLIRKGSKLRLALPEERYPCRLESPQTDWDRIQGLISEFRRGDAPVARTYLDRTSADRQERILDLLDVWAAAAGDTELQREAALIRFGLRRAAA
jgi:adenine-specific DNA methylase